MSSPEKLHAIRLALHAAAQQAHLHLPSGGIPPEGARETVTHHGVTVIVTAIATPQAKVEIQVTGTPAPGPAAQLMAAAWNQCERDILDLLVELGASPTLRYTRSQIDTELMRRGKDHGDSTVSHALARLTRRGLLTNAHDHKGYGLPLSATS